MSILDRLFPKLTRKEAEDASLDAAREQVVQQFNEQFPSNYASAPVSSSVWIIEVYAGYVIACIGSDYYKVTYSGSGDAMEFAPRNEWTEVQRKTQWDAVVKEMRAKADAGKGGYLVTDASGKKHLPTTRNGKPDKALAGAAHAALFSAAGFRGQPYAGPNKDAAKKKLRALYEREGWDWPSTTKEASMAVQQGANGKWRWVLFSSSSFEDKDEEIVSKEFHHKDVARMNKTKEFGTLDWWHVGTPTDADPEPAKPMLAIGDCDFSDYHETPDGLVRIESGTFYDERIGEAFSKQEDLSASLAFTHGESQPDKQGVFHRGRTVERSILPEWKASNLLADMFTHKETAVEKTKELAERLGPDGEQIVDELLKRAESKMKAAKAAGLTSKETKTDKPADDEAAEDKPDDEAAEGEDQGKKKMPKAVKKEADAPETDAAETITRKEVDDRFGRIESKLDRLTDALTTLFDDAETEGAATKEQRAQEQKRIDKLEATIVAATKELKLLKGDMPRALKTYRPSQDDDNELEPEEAQAMERLKSKETFDDGSPAGSPIVDWIIGSRKPTV